MNRKSPRPHAFGFPRSGLSKAALPSRPLAFFWAALPPVGHTIRWIHLSADFVRLLQHKTGPSLLLLFFLPPSVLTPHQTQCSVLHQSTISAPCKRHLPHTLFCASHHVHHFLSFIFLLSLSLAPPPPASSMWSFVLSLPAATYGLVWQLLSYLGLSGAFRMHKG